MDSESTSPKVPSRQTGALRLAGFCVAVVLTLYLAVAYLIIPFGWTRYAKHHSTFDDNPRLTKTSDGHPGDPLNVGLIGTETEVKDIMAAAQWFAANPLGLRSDLKIAADTVLKRSYDAAPVSSLFLFGRKEDLAFERPVGGDPSKRNHVRFWRTVRVNDDGRPIWIGSASYDERVGLSHTTGQITHHIASDVDVERDKLMTDLQQTNMLADSYKVVGFHQVLAGKNDGGDPWHTDGDLQVGVIDAK